MGRSPLITSTNACTKRPAHGPGGGQLGAGCRQRTEVVLLFVLRRVIGAAAQDDEWEVGSCRQAAGEQPLERELALAGDQGEVPPLRLGLVVEGRGMRRGRNDPQPAPGAYGGVQRRDGHRESADGCVQALARVDEVWVGADGSAVGVVPTRPSPGDVPSRRMPREVVTSDAPEGVALVHDVDRTLGMRGRAPVEVGPAGRQWSRGGRGESGHDHDAGAENGHQKTSHRIPPFTYVCLVIHAYTPRRASVKGPATGCGLTPVAPCGDDRRMVTVDDVRAVVVDLPRSYEVLVHDRVKFRVGQLVYVAFSRDETQMGFGFPREERADLVANRPEVFLMPPESDLRFAWVLARLDALDLEEMRELVLSAWTMVVPKRVAREYFER